MKTLYLPSPRSTFTIGLFGFDVTKVKEYKDAVIIGLTDDGYETMAINFAQIRKFIVLQREVIKKYKEYYEGSQNGSKETSKGQ